jgi:hypothetical protein
VTKVFQDAEGRGEGVSEATIEVSVGLIKRMLEDQYDHTLSLTRIG